MQTVVPLYKNRLDIQRRISLERAQLSRLIVKLNGTIIAHRISSLAVDVLGAAGLPYEPPGEALEDDEAMTWQIDNMHDVGLIIGGGLSNIQRNIIGERGLGLPREPRCRAVARKRAVGVTVQPPREDFVDRTTRQHGRPFDRARAINVLHIPSADRSA